LGRPRLLWKTPPSGSTSSSETGKRPPTAPAARWSVGPVGGAKWILDGTLQRHDYLKLRERYRYWEITDSTYTFQLERAYDDGEGWQTYPLVKATKVADVARSMN
jgi:hypothetical protein